MQMEEEIESNLSKKNNTFSNYSTQEGLALKNFTSCLTWICMDQSSLWKSGLSWSIFFLLTICVPIVSHFVYQCSTCDEDHRRPYDALVQLSLSLFATISFVSVSFWSRKYGVRRFLFIDKLCDVSDKVRVGYEEQLQRSMKLICLFVLPCFAAVTVYKVWWFISGATQIPYLSNIYICDTIACILLLFSWLYRTSIYILVCVLYRLTCYMHILRLEDYAQVFQKETEVASILIEHLKIRSNLRIISHRFRAFILLSLILVTASQFTALLLTTRSNSDVNIFKAGELALCSISLVTGLFICLRSATKITHKAQSIISLAAKWHVCATINSFSDHDGETPTGQITSAQVFPGIDGWDLIDEEEDEDDDLAGTRIMPIYAHTISFQKRQALVTYLKHNGGGITVFGFVLDRSSIHTIFVIQLALLLWLLNKTIGIS